MIQILNQINIIISTFIFPGSNSQFKLPEKFALSESQHFFDHPDQDLTLTSSFPAMESAPYPSPILADAAFASGFEERNKSETDGNGSVNTADTNQYDFYS